MIIQLDGLSTAYRLEGPEHAPVVTLGHGIATDLTLWDGVAPRLVEAGFRVLRFDARGHGETSAPPGKYTLAALGQDLLALMTALGIERAHVAGLSMGGMVGLGLAIEHPERLLSLICCDARASAPADYQTAWSARAETVARDGMEPMVAPTVSRWFAAGFQDRAPADFARVEAMVRRTAPAGYCGCAAALQGLDYGKRLGEIRMPVLYLVGAEDAGAPPDVMRAMHEATPESRFVEIAKAGHLSAIEQPAAVAAAMIDLISEAARG